MSKSTYDTVPQCSPQGERHVRASLNSPVYESGGINVEFFSRLPVTIEYRPYVYSGGSKIFSVDNRSTFDVFNTGPWALEARSDTLAVIPPLVYLPVYVINGGGGDDEGGPFCPLWTVPYEKFKRDFEALLMTMWALAGTDKEMGRDHDDDRRSDAYRAAVGAAMMESMKGNGVWQLLVRSVSSSLAHSAIPDRSAAIGAELVRIIRRSWIRHIEPDATGNASYTGMDSSMAEAVITAVGRFRLETLEEVYGIGQDIVVDQQKQTTLQEAFNSRLKMYQTLMNIRTYLDRFTISPVATINHSKVESPIIYPGARMCIC